jgi:hypothetical protein
VVSGRDRLVLLVAGDRAHVAGSEQRVDPRVRGGEQRHQGRRHEHVSHEHGEVAEAQPRRAKDRHGVGGSCGLEADGEEDDPPQGVLPRQLERVEGRVDHAHVAAARLH